MPLGMFLEGGDLLLHAACGNDDLEALV